MPNTQAGLPLKDHLWKLPSLGTQPTSPRCALAFPRGFATGQIHCDELLGEQGRGVSDLDFVAGRIQELANRGGHLGADFAMKDQALRLGKADRTLGTDMVITRAMGSEGHDYQL